MAGVKDKDLIHFEGWKEGIDNLSDESQVTKDFLRVAENVDLDKFGKPSRRRGYARVHAGTSCRSLYSHEDLDFALFADDTNLSRMDVHGNVTLVKAGFGANNELSYDTVNLLTYLSNGLVNGCVTAAGTFHEWGCETPLGPPILSANANGGLHAGNYQVAVTFMNVRGEESGAYVSSNIDVAEGGGINAASIPQPISAEVLTARLYVTPFDGDVFYFYRDLPIGMTSAVIGFFSPGKVLDTQFLGNLPPGQIVRYLNGRMYVAAGKVLWMSEAQRYGLTHLANGYLPFDAHIDMMEPADTAQEPGMFVASGKSTFFLPSGATAKPDSIRVVYPFGVIPGTAVTVPGSIFGQGTEPVTYWIASNGVACLGLPSGQVTPLKEKYANAPLAARGASLYREDYGKRQVITALGGATGNNFGMGDTAVATVYRNGVAVP